MINPTPPQEGLNDLVSYFMGEDWYVSESLGEEQVNTIAIEDIKAVYPKWLVRMIRLLFLGV